MKKIQMLCVVFIGCLLVSFSGVVILPGQPSVPEVGDHAGEGELILTGYPYSGTAPAVAYSTKSEQYLLVFEGNQNNGGIVGVFIDANTGENLSLFNIQDSTLRAKNPDVAYDSDNDRFLVVYERENSSGDFEIYGRLIYGGWGNPNGWFPFFSDTKISGKLDEDDYDPAVTYNSDEKLFAVVFVRAPKKIMGRLVQADDSEPTPLGTEAFTILSYTSGNVYTPDVAWTKIHNSFLAVWHRDRPSGADWIHAYYLHDADMSGSILDQKYGNVVKIAPHNEGDFPLLFSCGNPSVAYDPSEDNFLVVFAHLEGSGSPAPRSIHGTRLNGRGDMGDPLDGYAFPIETSLDSENHTHNAPGVAYCGLENEMHVAYATADIGAAGGDL